jgi:hypothetical protein
MCYAEVGHQKLMSRPLLALYVVTVLALAPMLLSMAAWGYGPTGGFVALGWLGLVFASLLGLRWIAPAAVIGLASAIVVWGGLLDEVGKLVFFHPGDGALYPVLLMPALLALAVAGGSLFTLLHDRPGKRVARLVAIGGVFGPLAALPVLFAHRSFPQSHFATFDLDTARGAEMAVMPGPADTRAFIVPLNSPEVVRAVAAANPDTSAGLYMSNARFDVEYDFGRLRRVTLGGFDDRQLDHPVTWTAGELRGDVTFLVPW